MKQINNVERKVNLTLSNTTGTPRLGAIYSLAANHIYVNERQQKLKFIPQILKETTYTSQIYYHVSFLKELTFISQLNKLNIN